MRMGLCMMVFSSLACRLRKDFAYHYILDYWDLFEVEELPHAPAWDGHMPEDVTRLLSLLSDSDD